MATKDKGKNDVWQMGQAIYATFIRLKHLKRNMRAELSTAEKILMRGKITECERNLRELKSIQNFNQPKERE